MSALQLLPSIIVVCTKSDDPSWSPTCGHAAFYRAVR